MEPNEGVFCKGRRAVRVFKLEHLFLANPKHLRNLVIKVGDGEGDDGHLLVVFGISYMTKTGIKFIFISPGTQVGLWIHKFPPLDPEIRFHYGFNNTHSEIYRDYVYD